MSNAPPDGPFFIIYPERKFVQPETIRTWYDDAVANQEISPEYLSAHDTQTMARALDDAGMITLAHPPKVDFQEI